jgi:hypothetical protein
VSGGHANASEKDKADRERVAEKQGFGSASEKRKADRERVALVQGFGGASEKRAAQRVKRSSEALLAMEADYARFLKADLHVDEQKLTGMQKRLLWRMKRYKAAGHQ